MSTTVISDVEVLNSTIVPKNHTSGKDVGESLLSSQGYLGATIVLSFIGVFGFSLNLFVMITMSKDKQLWTPMNIIILNLVCSDFLVSILGNPLTISSSIAHKWIFGQTVCIVYGFIMSLLGITSITTLTVLAFERYLMVSKPFNPQHLTRRNLVFIILGIWVYSLTLTTPPLLGWGDYVNEAANISCSVNWEQQTFNATTYILFLFFFGLFVPVCIISFSYANIIRTLKQNNKRVGRVNKVEGRVTCMVAIMIAAFLIAWTPYAILALLIQFGDPKYVSSAVAVIPALFAKSSICYNPIIYVGLNTQFRSSMKRLFGYRDENALAATSMFPQTTQESIEYKKKSQDLPLTTFLSNDDSKSKCLQSTTFVVNDEITNKE